MRALVTGAARGLGRAVAERLATDGGRVALMDVASSVEGTSALIDGLGGSAFPVRGDVSSEDDAERAVDEVIARFGGLDLLVNNAGIGGPMSNLVDTSIEAIRLVLEVNLVGAMIMSREAARAMIEQGSGGAIINLGSVFGQQGVAGESAYCASKGGIALLTHSIALELAPFGIRVNTIAPGNMATEMHWDDLRARAKKTGVAFDATVEAVRASIPLGRHGEGADIAGAVAWLASDDASYVTGQTISVNGGAFLT